MVRRQGAEHEISLFSAETKQAQYVERINQLNRKNIVGRVLFVYGPICLIRCLGEPFFRDMESKPNFKPVDIVVPARAHNSASIPPDSSAWARYEEYSVGVTRSKRS